VALRPGQRRALPKNRAGRQAERIEQLKARVRALVEHPFHWIKNIFGLKKVRYRGLAKNTAQLFTLFALANLMIAKRWLLAPWRGRCVRHRVSGSTEVERRALCGVSGGLSWFRIYPTLDVDRGLLSGLHAGR
jgi:hypothetical protein